MSATTGPTAEVAQLAREHREFLIAFARGLGATLHDAEEHVDDALFEYLEELREYGDAARAENPRAMLCVRVQFRVINGRQRVQRRAAIVQRNFAPVAPDGHPSAIISAVNRAVLADYGVLSQETVDAITAAVHELPARMQEIFALCVVEELSAKVVAERLKLRHDTVRRWRAHAIDRLRRTLEAKGLTPWTETPRAIAARKGGEA